MLIHLFINRYKIVSTFLKNFYFLAIMNADVTGHFICLCFCVKCSSLTPKYALATKPVFNLVFCYFSLNEKLGLRGVNSLGFHFGHMFTMFNFLRKYHAFLAEVPFVTL